MASLARSLSTRVSRIEKPKPLKNIVSNRHSFSDKESFLQTNAEQVIDFRTPEIATRSGPEDVILMLEIVSSNIQNKDYSNISSLTNSLTSRLKNLGTQLEEYEEKLDKIFEIIRNGAHDISIDKQSRLSLMQLVELRASQWQMSPGSSTYYAAKSGFHPEVGEVYAESGFDFSQHQLLGPADVIKSSGKYNSPTRVPGKNYCKDEVVIRNSDSGKVMGIKGRRVHMIEELSETVISFQRVNPGAKERLVQITGPTEDKIIYAKNLIEDTIKRNASPVREIGGYREVAGSNSSINSSASDDSNWPNTPSGRLASNAASKESTEFKYSVHVLNDVIHISSTNLNLLNEAFSLLDSSYAVTEEISGLSTQHFSPSSKQDLHQNLPFSSSSKELPLHGSDLSHGFLTQYTREFLIDCSKSKAAQRPPANLALIAAQNPAIVKQVAALTNPVF